MFYLVNLKVKEIISSHRTMRAANMAMIKFDKEFYEKSHTYIPTAILYKKGDRVGKFKFWINDPEIELGLTDPPGREGEHIWEKER